jgi:hypothetical protein
MWVVLERESCARGTHLRECRFLGDRTRMRVVTQSIVSWLSLFLSGGSQRKEPPPRGNLVRARSCPSAQRGHNHYASHSRQRPTSTSPHLLQMLTFYMSHPLWKIFYLIDENITPRVVRHVHNLHRMCACYPVQRNGLTLVEAQCFASQERHRKRLLIVSSTRTRHEPPTQCFPSICREPYS